MTMAKVGTQVLTRIIEAIESVAALMTNRGVRQGV
jgi:hypothetical protein